MRARPSYLLNTGVSTARVLYPVLAFPEPETHGHREQGAMNGHRHVEGSGAANT